MGLPGCLFVCLLILLLVCFLFKSGAGKCVMMNLSSFFGVKLLDCT